MSIWNPEEVEQVLEENKEEERKEKKNVVQLRPITGGKGPTNGNWLTSLGVNCIFVARLKKNKLDKSELEEYKINRITERTVQLINMPYTHTMHGLSLHDPDIFCNQWELVEVLGVSSE